MVRVAMKCGKGGKGRRECPTTESDDVERSSTKRLCQHDDQPSTDHTDLADPQEIRHAILHSLDEPLVFRGYLSSSKLGSGWQCLRWDTTDWCRIFAERELTFRVGPRVGEGVALSSPQWESGCFKSFMCYVDFLDFAKGLTYCKTTCDRDVDCDTHWAYFDYYYLRYLESVEELRSAVNWGPLGFPERGVKESTIWIGSPGANTPCHIDTYGCNLVAQVKGRKRWVLFPKLQSQNLYVTRIPYEESSIYSSAGFPRPSLKSHPKLALTQPYVVTLEPGDVLFVPKHWWHSVENLDLAISINTWVELPSDREERVKETLVMYQMATLCQGVESFDLIRSLFNPNMMDVPTMTSSSLLNLLVNEITAVRERREARDEGGDTEAIAKPNHTYTKAAISSKHLAQPLSSASLDLGSNWGSDEWLQRHGIHKVPSMSFHQYQQSVLGWGEETGTDHSSRVDQSGVCEDKAVVPVCRDGVMPDYSDSLKLMVEAFTDERVIDILKKVIDEKLEMVSKGKKD